MNCMVKNQIAPFTFNRVHSNLVVSFDLLSAEFLIITLLTQPLGTPTHSEESLLELLQCYVTASSHLAFGT